MRWRRTACRSASRPPVPRGTVTSLPGMARGISRTSVGRARSTAARRSHQNPLVVPTIPLVTKTVMGTPFASAIGNAWWRLSLYPSSKVTTTRGRTRRPRQIRQRARLPAPHELFEVGGEACRRDRTDERGRPHLPPHGDSRGSASRASSRRWRRSPGGPRRHRARVSSVPPRPQPRPARCSWRRPPGCRRHALIAGTAHARQRQGTHRAHASTGALQLRAPGKGLPHLCAQTLDPRVEHVCGGHRLWWPHPLHDGTRGKGDPDVLRQRSDDVFGLATRSLVAQHPNAAVLREALVEVELVRVHQNSAAASSGSNPSRRRSITVWRVCSVAPRQRQSGESSDRNGSRS